MTRPTPILRSASVRCVVLVSTLLPVTVSTAADRAAAERLESSFDWTVGEWRGMRRDGQDGSEASMRMVIEPVLGGAGQTRVIEVEHGGGIYHGFAVQVFNRDLGRWVRQYVNAARGRFSRLEGEIEKKMSVWRSVTPGRSRESRLVSERPGPDRWRRTMSISSDGGATWRVLWIDELTRASQP